MALYSHHPWGGSDTGIAGSTAKHRSLPPSFLLNEHTVTPESTNLHVIMFCPPIWSLLWQNPKFGKMSRTKCWYLRRKRSWKWWGIIVAKCFGQNYFANEQTVQKEIHEDPTTEVAIEDPKESAPPIPHQHEASTSSTALAVVTDETEQTLATHE